VLVGGGDQGVTMTPSKAADAGLSKVYDTKLKGWIFYAQKNKQPLAVAGHGLARRVPVDGLPARAYDENTLVHVASVSKLICAVGVLRLIEDWNEIFQQTTVQPSGRRSYVGPSRSGDEFLIARVEEVGRAISIDDKYYSLVEPFLVWKADFFRRPDLSMTTIEVRFSTPGLGVQNVTIKELLQHRSGLTDDKKKEGQARMASYGGFEDVDIFDEVTADNMCFFDLVKACVVVCAADVGTKDGVYSNVGFDLLSGLVQFNVGCNFEDWARKKLFPDARFDDIAKRPVDPARAAYYYGESDGGAALGVFHPDYRHFSFTGGFYTSPRAICDWVDAVMTDENFNGRPILKNSSLLLSEFLGCDKIDLGFITGLAKNGGASPRNGHTNARIGWLRGFGKERVTVFFQSNEPIKADPALALGLHSIRRWAYPPATVPPPPLAAPLLQRGQLKAVVWTAALGDVAAQEVVIAPQNQTVALGGRSLSCSDLLGGASSGINPNQTQIIRFTSYLLVPKGSYIFEMASNDGSLMFLDDVLVIDNDGNHPLKSVMSESVDFDGSAKKLEIIWYNSVGAGGLYLAQSNVQSPDAPAPLPAAWIFPTSKLLPRIKQPSDRIPSQKRPLKPAVKRPR
jgi:CubicO group peptidase (beta-lactamase class C family)